MLKIILYHEEQRQGFWLLGSKSRCSISSRRVVLLNNGKKRGRRRIGPIFKSFWKIFRKCVEFILALGFIAKLALLVLSWLGW
jgi:hypothetical protein